MNRHWTSFGAGLLVLTLLAAPGGAGEREVRTVESAADTVRELVALKLQGIPQAVLRDARGVAVISGVVKAGFVIDGRIGQGVVLARQPDGAWSNPVFTTFGGLGIGWQAGVEATDVVLVFRTARSLDRVLRGRGKLTLGADASVAVGPVGREVELATDALLRAEIFCYSRSRGLFVGVSVEGAALRVNPRANEAFYGPRIGQPAVVLGRREVAAVETLKAWLNSLGAPPVVIVPQVVQPLPTAAPVVPLPPAPPGLPPAPVPFPPAPAPGR